MALLEQFLTASSLGLPLQLHTQIKLDATQSITSTKLINESLVPQQLQGKNSHRKTQAQREMKTIEKEREDIPYDTRELKKKERKKESCEYLIWRELNQCQLSCDRVIY